MSEEYKKYGGTKNYNKNNIIQCNSIISDNVGVMGDKSFLRLRSKDGVNYIESGKNTYDTSNDLVFSSITDDNYNMLDRNKMIIKGSGEVGIGTIFPDTKLDVRGTTTAYEFRLGPDHGRFYSDGNETIETGEFSEKKIAFKSPNNPSVVEINCSVGDPYVITGINMKNNRIYDLSGPIDDYDAANKKYVDNAVATGVDSYVPLTGGTMTGQLGFDIPGSGDIDKIYLSGSPLKSKISHNDLSNNIMIKAGGIDTSGNNGSIIMATHTEGIGYANRLVINSGGDVYFDDANLNISGTFENTLLDTNYKNLFIKSSVEGPSIFNTSIEGKLGVNCQAINGITLDVSGNIGVQNEDTAFIIDSSGNKNYIKSGIDYTSGSRDLIFSGSGVGSEKMIITNTGEVGIRVMNPTQTLQVNGSLGLTNSNAGIKIIGDSTGNYIQSGDSDLAGFTSRDLYFSGINASSKKMVIKSNGNIGIGTTNPINKLDISGSLGLNCNLINDISGINFCDGTYIGHGNSFDISTNEDLHIRTSKNIIIDSNELELNCNVNMSNNKIIFNNSNVLLGEGTDSSGQNVIGIGYETHPGTNSIAIGSGAGYSGQGVESIAIGGKSGYMNQHDNTIILNSTGSNLDSDRTNAFYVAPIRNNAGSNLLQYNSTTKEITYSNSINGIRITDVADPSNNTDAVNKQYVDDNYLPLTGGVITGDLIIGGEYLKIGDGMNIKDDFQQINGNINQTSFTSSRPFIKFYDGSDELLSLNRITTKFSSNLDMSNNKITNLAHPTNNTDAVNKEYVDTGYLPLTGGVITGDLTTDVLTVNRYGSYNITNKTTKLVVNDGISILGSSPSEDFIGKGSEIYFSGKYSGATNNTNHYGSIITAKENMSNWTNSYMSFQVNVGNILNQPALGENIDAVVEKMRISSDGTVRIKNNLIVSGELTLDGGNNARLNMTNIIDMGNSQIMNLGAPTDSHHATNKEYVDNKSKFICVKPSNDINLTSSNNFTENSGIPLAAVMNTIIYQNNIEYDGTGFIISEGIYYVSFNLLFSDDNDKIIYINSISNTGSSLTAITMVVKHNVKRYIQISFYQVFKQIDFKVNYYIGVVSPAPAGFSIIAESSLMAMEKKS